MKLFRPSWFLLVCFTERNIFASKQNLSKFVRQSINRCQFWKICKTINIWIVLGGGCGQPRHEYECGHKFGREHVPGVRCASCFHEKKQA